MPDTMADFYWGCCRFPILTYTLYPVLLADLKLFWCWDVPHLSVLSFFFCLPRYKAFGSPPMQPCHGPLFSADPHGCGHTRMLCLQPGLIHNIHNIHYSTCCLLKNKLVLEATFIRNRLKSLQLLCEKTITFPFKTTGFIYLPPVSQPLERAFKLCAEKKKKQRERGGKKEDEEDLKP